MMKKFFLAIILISGAFQAKADKQVVLFGDTIGSIYFPGFVQVDIGDTVVFIGNFTEFPLQSVSVPQGAVSFSRSSGSEPYQYVVMIAGIYNYHNPQIPDMVGTISAEAASAVFSPVKPQMSVYPSRTGGIVNVELKAIPHATETFLEVYTLTGKKIHSQPISQNRIELSLTNFQNGIYVVTIRENNKLLSSARVVKTSEN